MSQYATQSAITVSIYLKAFALTTLLLPSNLLRRSTFLNSRYYICLLLLSIRGIIKFKGYRNNNLMFLYLILLGFIRFYSLTERQGRYSFICSWIFVLTAGSAFCKETIKYRKQLTIQK